MNIVSHHRPAGLQGPMLSCVVLVVCLVAALCPTAWAVSLGPDFVGQYSVKSLVPGGPSEAFVFKAGDANHILVAPGQASESTVSQYPVLRGPGGAITGFGAAGDAFATVTPLGDDGGRIFWLGYGPAGILFGRGGFGVPTLLQLKTGSTTPDKSTALADFGFTDCCYSGNGKTTVVPAGFPGAGRIKMVVGKHWADATATLAADGTASVSSPQVTLDLFEDYTGQNFVFVEAGAAGFARPSVLISHSDGMVYAFEIDSHGDPVPSTRRAFATGVRELGDRDPVTKQFLLLAGDPVTTYVVAPGQSQSPVVQNQEPPSGTTFAVGTLVIFRGVARQSNGAIARVVLRRDNVDQDVNEGPFGTADGHADYYLQARLPSVPGEFSYRISATAADGSTGESVPVVIRTVVIANQLPIARVDLETPPTRKLCESVRLRVSGSDSDGLVKNIYVVEGSRVLGQVAGASGRVVLRELPAGVHHLTIEAQDDRGGIGVVDTTVTIVNPPANTVAGDFGLDGRFAVCFAGSAGATYEAEWASPVNGGWVWHGLGPKVADSNPLVWHDPTSGADAIRVYRVHRRP